MTTKATRDVLDLAIRPILNINIDGGSVNGTVIGNEEPDEGYFTNLTCENLTVTNSLDLSGASVSGAIHAYYADLAEYYQADYAYPPGTVVMLGGEREITAADETAYGVVSTNPAYVMNAPKESTELDLPVALVGKVPCFVVGKVKKFDRLVPFEDGVAKAYNNQDNEKRCFARVLEDNDDNGLRLVMVALTRS